MLFACGTIRRVNRYRAWFWVLAVSAGLFQTWASRFYIEPDGVNYLDVAVAYLRHDWPMALNSYWSPLYSWLLAGVLYVVSPAPYWESTALHVLNFVVFLVALRCGEFFISELIASRKDNADDRLPPYALWWIGYSLLIFASLFLIGIDLDTPDLCVSALVYAAGGLLIRILTGNGTPRTFALFGVILGIAYLTKTVMFLVAFPFLLAAGRRRGTALALACFAAVSLPWIGVLSHSVGRVTYGDAGWTNYVWYVAGSGAALHPPRVIFAAPEVREFATPIRASYPPWYSTYWVEGVRPRFDWRAQLMALKLNAKEYLRELYGQKEYIAAFLLLFFAQPIRRLTAPWPVLLPVFAAFGLYGLVHVETRLVAPFFVLLWLILFSDLRVRGDWLVRFAVLAVMLVTVFKVARADILTRRPAHLQWQVAEAVQQMGVSRGSRVAYFGHTTDDNYWAHLGGFEIAADIQKDAMPAFWSAPQSLRGDIFARLAELDVRAVLARSGPAGEGWQQIKGTPYYVYLLKQ